MTRRRDAALRAARSVWKLPAGERALLHATRGRPFKGWPSKLPPLPTQYPRGTVRDVTRYGLRLRLDLADVMGWYAYWGFQDPSHDAFVELCRPGMHVIDVGANIGLTALRAAASTTGSRVLAIEPDPNNFGQLTANVAANPGAHVQLLHAGVADDRGEMHVETPAAHNRGRNRLTDAPRGPRVSVATLDELVDRTDGFERIDVIKVDTEGFELRVLVGATRTIARWHPTLFVEVNDDNLRDYGTSADELLSTIRELGYSSLLDARTGRPMSGAGEPFDVICRP